MNDTQKMVKKLAWAMFAGIIVVILILAVFITQDAWWLYGIEIMLAAVLGAAAYSLYEIAHGDSDKDEDADEYILVEEDDEDEEPEGE